MKMSNLQKILSFIFVVSALAGLVGGPLWDNFDFLRYGIFTALLSFCGLYATVLWE